MAINKTTFTQTFRDREKTSRTYWHNWRADALDDFAFIAGRQWMQSDISKLEEEKRPPITFNYSEKMIDAVVGAEVSNRQEVTYKPRGVEDSGVAELWNAAAKWVRDECNAEDEETDAFRDMLICGLGWTHTRMDYTEDPDGKLIIERVDPIEMGFDPAASKPGLVDRRYHWRRWWVDEKDAKQEWPGNFNFPTAADEAGGSGVIQHNNRYDSDNEEEDDRHKGQVQITHYECVEHENFYRIALPDSIEEMDSATFAKMRKQLDAAGIMYVKQKRKVYYQAFFAGEELLEHFKSPCQSGFVFQAITGKRDRNKNTWYGITRVMKDPQRWANKWLSQILHIVNSNAKGGLLAEINAFVDPRKAAEEWAKPESITLLNEGGLSKVEQKTPTAYPSGIDRLMEFALGSLPMVTGINMEALGLANREQAGVLEAQRKQAAYGLLSPFFDSLRRYRKVQGHVLLYFINEFITDGRLIRIGGPEAEQLVPFTKQPGAMRFDVIVDQSPNAPDVKQKTWETLMQLIPSLLKAGVPIPPDLLDYTPLPVGLTAKWKQFVTQQEKPSPEMEKMQEEMQKLQEENQSMKQDQQVEMAALQQKEQQAMAELELKRQVAAEELRLKREQALADFDLEKMKQDQDFELEQRRCTHEANIKERQMEGDLKVKAFTAGVSSSKDKEGKGKMSLALDMGPLVDMVKQMGEHMQQAQEENRTVVQELTEAISKPRKLVTDAKGKPIGSAPADKLN